MYFFPCSRLWPQVPPSAPLAFVSDVANSTLTVRWRHTNAGAGPVLGQSIGGKSKT